jgi:hypothetical protein
VKHFSRGVWLINVIKKERKTRFHEISLALFYRTEHGEDITRQFKNLALVAPPKKRPIAKRTKKLKNRVFALTSQENPKSNRSITKPLKSNSTTIHRVIKKDFKKIKNRYNESSCLKSQPQPKSKTSLETCIKTV